MVRTRTAAAASSEDRSSWSDRPATPRAPQWLYDDVLLSDAKANLPGFPGLILDTLQLTEGLHALKLGRICRVWRDAAAAKRDAWQLLQLLEPADCPQELRLVQFNSPAGAVALPAGGMIVADTFNHRLLVFSHPDEAPREIRLADTEVRNSYPRGLASDGESIFVSETGTCRVRKFRLSDGEELGSIGGQGTGEGHFSWPDSLCLAGGTLYATDGTNDRIVALDAKTLAWQYSFGSHGGKDGQFRGPAAVTVLGGELFVSDRVNHRIQVFAPDADGRMRFKRKFGGQGLAPGRFHEPRGLAAVRGKLVVAEDKRVQCLSPSGAPLQVVPVPGRHTRLRGVGAASGVGASEQCVWVADHSVVGPGGDAVHVLRVLP